MTITVLGANSAGNCYLMQNESECLIIELGVNFKEVKKALNFNLSKVVGALVTHEHGDHCLAMKNALEMGINVVTSLGTARKLGFGSNPRFLPICEGVVVKLGKFEIMAFKTNHAAADPLGFLIKHPDSGVTCFITDSYYVTKKFSGLNNVIVEANYDPEILMAGDLEDYRKDKIISGHMSIETCIDFLKNQDLTSVNNIMLVHLSDRNSNAADFKLKAQEATGKTITIAQKGTVINISSNPF